MQILWNALPLILFGVIVYGLTRDKVTQSWGKWVAGIAAVALLAMVISSPDDGCYVDWDGRSNPTVCD